MPAMMHPGTPQKQQGKDIGMHGLHPWAIGDVTSIASLQVEANRGVIALGGQARYAAEEDLNAQGVSDTFGVKTLKIPTTIEEATTQ
jgi:hypothetical protein